MVPSVLRRPSRGMRGGLPYNEGGGNAKATRNKTQRRSRNRGEGQGLKPVPVPGFAFPQDARTKLTAPATLREGPQFPVRNGRLRRGRRGPCRGLRRSSRSTTTP